MRPKSNLDMRMPLFFKLWFAFVACIALTIMGGTFYVLFQVVKAGPEGIGREIGAFVKSVKDASQ